MIWWYWVVLGLALAALELATPGGFFVIFFAISALLLGLLELAGIAGGDTVQWFLFPIAALIFLALFRKPLLARMRRGEGPDTVDSLVGEVAVATDLIAPLAHGRAELRGSSWSARNIGATVLSPGQRSRVVAVHGLELDIRPE
jgi:membrane protein implicated in regulation of membrane protease activity